MKTTVDFIDAVSDRCSTCLPINNSFIPLQILNQTMIHHLNDQDLSLKNLYVAIKSSDLGARNHISRLEKNRWLTIEKSTLDKRAKLIKPTKKLLDTYELMSHSFTPTVYKFCKDCPYIKRES